MGKKIDNISERIIQELKEIINVKNAENFQMYKKL